MSLSSIRSNLDSTRRTIAELERTDAQEARREADYISKGVTALDASRRSNNPTNVSSRMKEYERANSEAAKVRVKRADLSRRIADKNKDLSRYIEQLAREETQEQKKRFDEQKRLDREKELKDRRAQDELRKIATEQRRMQNEREEHERRITAELKERAQIIDIKPEADQINQDNDAHDFFISHASEDKEAFVAPLALELQARGAKVWYDDFTLKVGDSLRRSIDKGLSNSKFGVVILSEFFFRKEWPKKELDGMFALESDGNKRILPIWHKVSKDEVAKFSPILSDKVALNTSTKTITEIVDDLMTLVC